MHEFSTLAVMIQEREPKDSIKFPAKVGLGKTPADAWLQNDDAGEYMVLEQSVIVRAGEDLVPTVNSPQQQSR